MICPPDSFFISPITFLFFPLGNGLSISKFEVSDLVLTSSAISLSISFVFTWKRKLSVSKILHFRHILDLQNHTEIHTLQFYLDLIWINLNKLAYLLKF